MNTGLTVFWCVVVVLVINHAVALSRALSKRATIFSGWCDFAVSSLWPFSTATAFWSWIAWDTDKEEYMGILCLVLMAMSVISFTWMLVGTFRACRKSLMGIVCGLLARFSSSVLSIFLVTKILSVSKEMRNGERKIGSGVLLLATMAGVFALLVLPLIHDGDKS